MESGSVITRPFLSPSGTPDGGGFEKHWASVTPRPGQGAIS